MTSEREGFRNRLTQIDRTHRKVARDGYVAHLADNGVIVVKPRKTLPTIPVRGLILLLLGFLFFKAVLFAHLGGQTYLERVETLSQGTLLEQVSAKVMTPDRISMTMAGFMPFLR